MSEALQTSVVAVLDDMFFSSKIKEAAKQAGIDLEIIENSVGLIETITRAQPSLIIIDLNSKKFNSLELVKEIKTTSELEKVPTLGFMPHVEEELKKQAVLVGCDVVMPRSRFSRELVEILKKYSS